MIPVVRGRGIWYNKSTAGGTAGSIRIGLRYRINDRDFEAELLISDSFRFLVGGTMQPLLEIRGLAAEGPANGQGLSDIDFDLHPNEIHAIIGESGSGKSTFARVLSGLHPYSAGSLCIKGRKIEIRSLKDARRYGISTVYEEPPLHPFLSVEENIYLGLLPITLPTRIISAKKLRTDCRKLLDNLEIDINPAKLVKELKLGDRQLIAIAKALASDPSILVMDEPCNGLDETQKAKLFQLIRGCANKGLGVIYLSQRLEEVLQVANRVSVLKNGMLRGTLSAAEAQRHPERIFRVMLDKNRSVVLDDDYMQQMLPEKMGGVVDTFFRTTELLASEYELQDVLNFISKRAMSIMNSDSCVIQIIDEETGSIVNRRKYDEGKSIEVQLKESLIKTVIENGTPFYITNLGGKDDAARYFIEEPESSIGAFLCVPIKIRSRIAGVIEVFYTSLHQFTPREIEVISTFANQAALAIENTRLLGRSALLQEAHHRIKNNLQSIISLLSLQLDFMECKSIESAINDTISRIKAIALVHDLLSKDEKGIGVINVKKILETVISSLKHPFLESGKVNLIVSGEGSMLSYRKAASLSLVVNELVSNCLKHAFPDGRGGEIIVSTFVMNNKFIIEIRDNGVGLPDGFDCAIHGNLGLSIVQTLVNKDLEGEVVLTRVSPNFGTLARICLPKD
ncbi:MAG: ATP-binding cassette domain-containing protein [Firmicutes bacterium]|nr:ATP-binding cassette domain-containing protein [Bacillota bacterium]